MSAVFDQKLKRGLLLELLKSPAGVVFILLSVILFSPTVSFFISNLILIMLSRFNFKNKKSYLFFVIYLNLLSLILIVASFELFKYIEDDFTSYYNDYLMFLNNGFSLDYFEYGLGFEIGVPILNYFFSLIINSNMPYIILSMHVVLMLMLLYYLIYRIAKRHFLDFNSFLLIFVLVIVLFKYGLAFNQLRQAYASIFILIALYSEKIELHSG